MSRGSEDQEWLHRQYLHAISRIPMLDEQEEADLVRHWREDQDLEARHKLIESHLRLVLRIARRVADEFGFKPLDGSPLEAWNGYSYVCEELVLAGNEGLLHALSRFDPSRGSRFAACARWSVWKACREEAKWLRSPVRHPKLKDTPCSESLDFPIKTTNETAFIPLERLSEPANDRLLALSPMVEARAALLQDPREARILRARYLTASPVALKVLADEFGLSVGRVHQLEQRAVQSLRTLLPQSTLKELAAFYLSNPSPPAIKVGNALYYEIDDRLDALAELFPWATQFDRIRAHRIADQERAAASDFNLNRVKAALDGGLTVQEAAIQLNLPPEAAEHLRQLVDWRHGQETRYTLTNEALAMLDEEKQNQAA